MFIYIFLLVFIYSVLKIFFVHKSIRNKKILLLTAHPDDEIMFFYPTIKELCKCNDLYLLCLSNGDYEKIGNIRENELKKLCKLIKFKNYKISYFEDNINKFWDINMVEDEIIKYININGIDILITFDERGISSHPNHISCYLGTKNIKNIDVFYLETVNIYRKFISLLDVINLNKDDIVFTNINLFQILYYMTIHWSQMKWYRCLFLIFSRYTYINTLKNTYENNISKYRKN